MKILLTGAAAIRVILKILIKIGSFGETINAGHNPAAYNNSGVI